MTRSHNGKSISVQPYLFFASECWPFHLRTIKAEAVDVTPLLEVLGGPLVQAGLLGSGVLLFPLKLHDETRSNEQPFAVPAGLLNEESRAKATLWATRQIQKPASIVQSLLNPK